jgi:hypothetical protein
VARLALNRDTPDFCLLSIQDYRLECQVHILCILSNPKCTSFFNYMLNKKTGLWYMNKEFLNFFPC